MLKVLKYILVALVISVPIGILALLRIIRQFIKETRNSYESTYKER